MAATEKLETNQCRSCYNAIKGLKLLTDLTECGGSQQISYAELLADVSNLNIVEDFHNELPKFICELCSRKLKAAQAFIQQTHEVHERLMAMLSNRRDDVNNDFSCLQEIPVQIKMEYDDDAVVDTESHSQCKEDLIQETVTNSVHFINELRNKGADDEEFSNISKSSGVASQLSKMLGILNKKMNLLTENNKVLHNQLKDIKNQNSIVLDVLSENTLAIENSFSNKNPKYIKMFPINTIEELNEIEDCISERNENEFISTIRAIAGQRGLKKGLADIMTPKLLIDFNLDGSHNKQRLLNYTKFINILFHGTYDENGSEKSFKCNLRDAIKLVKNRYFKEKCISRKIQFDSKDNYTQDMQQFDIQPVDDDNT